jgi:hypothetical protein
VADLLDAHVPGREVAVEDVGFGVDIEQRLDRGARRVIVVAEAVGEERQAEARESGAHLLRLQEIGPPPTPPRPLAGHAGREVLLGAEPPR